MKELLLSIVLVAFISRLLQAQPEVDITGLSGGILTTQFDDSPFGEEIGKLTDNFTSTKFLTFNSSVWVQFKSTGPYVISKYTLTSGNDAPERDPLKWTLAGSDNGVTFYTIDVQNDQDFPDRGLRREFILANNSKAFSYYRLTMTNNSGYILQVSELELFGVPGVASKELFADFSISTPLVAGSKITFTNASLNAASYTWMFEGGNPSTSSEVNPEVTYNSPGDYFATLIASGGTNTSSRSMQVVVRDINDWSSFISPDVNIECLNTTNPGYIKYIELVARKGFSSPDEFVKACCLVIAKEFYYTPEEANAHNLRRITYKLNEGGALSYKSGNPPDIEIGFDLNYLNTFSQSHTDSASADEIYGVLCHEISHGYQKAPKNAGVYGTPGEFFGFIEGSADLARLLTGGFNPPRTPKTGGNWKDGYNVTAFFYLWITETMSANFLRDLNITALTISPWSLNSATKQIFGQSAQALWNQYQMSVGNSFEKSSGIKIYPNPAENTLFLGNLEGTCLIEIYNMMGMELLSKSTAFVNEMIDISAFASGVYIVKVSNNEVVKTTQFVKK